MADEESTLSAIHRLYGEVVETQQQIKMLRDNVKDVLLQNTEFQQLQEEIKTLTAKRQQAKKLLESDRDFQILNSELEELKFKHRDLLEIMSHHLMTHRDSTHEDSIQDPEGEARQIIVNAKLGKPEAITGGGSRRTSNKPLPGQTTLESHIDGYK